MKESKEEIMYCLKNMLNSDKVLEFGRYLKKRIEVLKKAQSRLKDDTKGFQFFQGLIEAYSDSFHRLSKIVGLIY